MGKGLQVARYARVRKLTERQQNREDRVGYTGMPIFLMCSERIGNNLITRAPNEYGTACKPDPNPLFSVVIQSFSGASRACRDKLLTDLECLFPADFFHRCLAFSIFNLERVAVPGGLSRPVDRALGYAVMR